MQSALWKILAVAASAVMFVLALPPADIAPLGLFCFTPVFVAFRGKGFAWGFVAGMAVLILGALVSWAGWFYQPSFTGASPEWNFTGYALFGLVVGLTCAIIGEVKDPPSWLPWALAAWAVLFEALLLVYIPAHLALTQYRIYPAMKVASIGGIWAVSYMAWALNLLLAQGYVARDRKTMALCGAFLGIYFGINAFTGFPKSSDTRVAMVQTESMTIDELAAFNMQASNGGAQIVVWPELSGTASAPMGNTAMLKELAAAQGHAPFVTTFEDDNSPLPSNVASVFSKDGESYRYEKRMLFGGETADHARGDQPLAVTVDGTNYGLNICFDSCFPSVMRETAQIEGVSMILLPTLDPVGPSATVQAFHAAYTPFRAAELGVPIVRADTTAYSMVVDARGVIVATMGPGVEGAMVVDVDLERRDTLYRRFGDWFLLFCGFLVLAGLIKGRTSEERRRPSSLEQDKQ